MMRKKPETNSKRLRRSSKNETHYLVLRTFDTEQLESKDSIEYSFYAEEPSDEKAPSITKKDSPQ